MKTLILLLLVLQEKYNYRKTRCWEHQRTFTITDKTTRFLTDSSGKTISPYNIIAYYHYNSNTPYKTQTIKPIK
jgi:hypothetical protein